MINILEEHYQAVEDFKTKAEQYKKGEIDPLRFKAFRVAMGVYEQRKSEVYMTRLRIPGGFVTLEQLELIAELAEKYSEGKIHFTSREGIQFHNLKLDDVHKIMEAAIKVGITTKGTGGNTVRNVTSSPLSGVSEDEVFDVTPYVKGVTDYLIKDPSSMNLPRKYKIAFSNSPEDTANATIADLGFIAKSENGVKCFEVYGAGGLGGNPREAIKMADFIEAKDVLFYVQALKDVFEKEGDRTNKYKARIRYIANRFGDEKFKELFENQLASVKNNGNLQLSVDEKPFERTSYEDGQEIEIEDKYKNIIIPQKQKGYYTVYVHPQSGNQTAAELSILLKFVKELPYETTFRVTNTQGLYIRDLKGNDAVKVSVFVESFGALTELDSSVTCAGASTCQLGLCLSQDLLQGIKEEFKDKDSKIKEALPRIFISGCPNSCGQHEKGAIGLSGRARRSEDGLVPSYYISLGGFVKAGGAKLGEVFGDIPAKKIPEFLVSLAELKVKTGQEEFYEFIKIQREEIRNLVEKYSSIESFNEYPELYYDFGSHEKFSIEGRGAGECSTGVFDVIKLDLSNAEGSLKKFEATKESSDLYDAAVSASRALLILKGIDTDKDRQIFKEFIINFVDKGYLRVSIKELFDVLIDYKLGDIKDLSDRAEDVRYVVSKVKALYESLNGKLEITLPKETDEEVKTSSENAQSDSDEFKVIDFRGVKCPINFVKVKVELSKIKSGEKRGFYLDDGDPINNVPKSVEKEGHKILSIDETYEGYNLLVVEKK